MHRGPPNQASTVGASPPEAASDERELLIIVDGVATHFRLEPDSVLSIGRSPTSDVTIDHPSVSRHHARLYIGDIADAIQIEDLGSANGVLLKGEPLARETRVSVGLGEVMDIGSVAAVIQFSSVTTPRLWSHDYFQTRLAEECARAETNGESLVLLRVRCRSPESLPSVLRASRAALPEGAVVGLYAPGDLEILLLDSDTREAERVRGELESAIEDFDEVQFGQALFPTHARNPHDLFAVANRSVRARPPSTPPLQSEDSLEGEPPPVDAVDAAKAKVDPPMAAALRLCERVAAGRISVLLTGETGVGKEVMAHQVHALSPRSPKPFVAVNCGAISQTLLESELFGFEKGAFTGAAKTKRGLFESASGGTLFLDEIGEMPLETQVKLLRVLETREVRRVGGVQPIPVDVRIVSATNRDLKQDVDTKTFRADLLFRLDGVRIEIPPLRQRPSELERLATQFAKEVARDLGLAAPSITDEAWQLLERYSWPGNIRELKNAIERAVLLCDGSIRPIDLPIEKVREQRGEGRERGESRESRESGQASRELSEKVRIEQALSDCGGNQGRAADLLGISRRTLTRRLTEHGIARPIRDRTKSSGPER